MRSRSLAGAESSTRVQRSDDGMDETDDECFTEEESPALPSLREGCRVWLSDLGLNADMNGQHATCVKWEDDAKRWLVDLDPAHGEIYGEICKVKPDNLSVANYSPASVRDQ